MSGNCVVGEHGRSAGDQRLVASRREDVGQEARSGYDVARRRGAAPVEVSLLGAVRVWSLVVRHTFYLLGLSAITMSWLGIITAACLRQRVDMRRRGLSRVAGG